MHQPKHLIFPILLLLSAPTLATDCLRESALKKLDHRYEQAIRTADTGFLSQLLKEQFVWVHNRASMFESKADLLARLKDSDYRRPKARTSEEVTAHIADTTAVLTGYTTVEQFNEDGVSTRWNRYQFMRTYVLEDGQCRLLAGKTGKVASGH